MTDSSDPQESERPEQIEPAKATSGPTVVGIGASAGGLAALKQLFALLPDNSGLAFVVVVHLSPEHKSHLADLLQSHVRMPVMQVADTTALEPNQVYVIPPGANLESIDTHLRLSPLEEERRARAPIDHFLRTLAGTHDGNSIGVILTGTGSDGTLGLREIKEQGGFTIVQDPNEAEYDGMPQSAVSGGAADVILPLASIPEAILNFVRTNPRFQFSPASPGEDDDRHNLQRMFALLRARVGWDFSRYKSATILRRITRRMQFHRLEELSTYMDLLRDHPDEARALADDLLINVTSFFRDPEAFKLLETKVVPRLFEDKTANDNLRVWSVGCATGEEAYSLTMLLLEEAARRNQAPRIQVFASELHGKSLERAREAFYPGDIESDVSPERLQRFFHKENGGFRVRKDVRELVVFAPHNILSDPPFSHVDLIACRNLLIYLQREVQHEVLEVFHYALEPDGYLLLGASETVDSAELFRVEDKKRCLYRKRNMSRPELRLPVFPVTRSKLGHEPPRVETPGEPVSFGALHQQMVEQVAPPSMLLSEDDKIVHLSAHAGRYLVHPGGELTAGVFKLVREELRTELRTALHQCRVTRRPIRTRAVSVRFDGHSRPVSLQVRPATEPQQEGFALVIFEEWTEDDGGIPDASEETRRDEAEADLVRRRLQTIIEEYETSQEELRSANEEMQSNNEELRSTLEELETSKEELQSMNEELQTVNQENRHKVDELAQLSGDLQNLLAATDIATLFLDRHLSILRFTPKVSELFNVRMTDRGRPLSNFTHRLGYGELAADARKVPAELVTIEREVREESGKWYLTRLRPYRSSDDRIEGVVITFIDITTRVRSEEERLQAVAAVRASEETLRELNAGLDKRVREQTAELRLREERLRAMAGQLIEAEQAERIRVASLLHDNLQQILVAAKMRTGVLQEESPADARLNSLGDLIAEALKVTRSLVAELAPPTLHDSTLEHALQWLATRMRDQHELRIAIHAEKDADPGADAPRDLMFQIARELLLNVVKHAAASTARIELKVDNGFVVMTVGDTGVGFDAAQALDERSSFGLSHAQRRLRQIGGRLEIESKPGEGARVSAFVPRASSSAVNS